MKLNKGYDYKLAVLCYPCVGVMTDVEDLQIALYTTDNANSIVFSGDSVSVSGFAATISIGANDLDPLEDGLINYVSSFNNSSGASFTYENSTTAWLTTPSGYSAGTFYTEEEMESAITESYSEGHESGYTEGYDAGQADCPECDCTEAYESGYSIGMAYQKSLLSSTEVTSNGTYTRENGWSAVTVNVSGTQCNLTPLMLIVDETNYSGGWIEEPTQGYDGFEYVSLDASNWTLEVLNSGHTEGVEYQKSLLSAATITENGTYTNENGWSAVTVNVSQSGGTSDITWAGKSAAFSGEAWTTSDYEDDVYYSPYFVLPITFKEEEYITFDFFIIDTSVRSRLLSSIPVDSSKEGINIFASNSGFTIEYNDSTTTISSGPKIINLECEMYDYAKYHMEMNNMGSNLIFSVVGPYGQSASTGVSACSFNYGVAQSNIVVNGIYDSDDNLYVEMKNSWMFTNLRTYGTGILTHNYQWYDGSILDTVNNYTIRAREQYWDADDQAWYGQFTDLNGYNDPYSMLY